MTLTQWTELPRASGIYRITHAASGRAYIGSAKDIHHRAGVHHRHLASGKHHSVHMQRIYRKYGADGLLFEIVEQVTQQMLLEREQHYIDTEKPVLNSAPKAANCAGVKHTAATKRKRSKASRAVWEAKSSEQRKEWGEQSSERMKSWWDNATDQQRQDKSDKSKAVELARISAMSEADRAVWKQEMSTRAAKSGALRNQRMSAQAMQGQMSDVLRAQMAWRERHPELVREAADRMKATKAARTPERRQQAIDRFRATMAAKKAA